MELVQVNCLKPGYLVDLESCPYLHSHSTAQFQLAEVTQVELETPECVVVSYEGIGDVGYPVHTHLKAKNIKS